MHKFVCLSFSIVGAYESLKSNSGLGQKISKLSKYSGDQSPQLKQWGKKLDTWEHPATSIRDLSSNLGSRGPRFDPSKVLLEIF